ncbi:hypothetical protein [Streptomyces brasiliensis]|uniref:Uncharacterized protein n=1 Tax=Streptomyces brasiliensis TaxID=1954 RepID=A0A917K9J2_9ACTN|nr:hypothetical protein [Streptomyces brasiliensis]GGJ02697.1 hypothetical protein GCM10010121_011410 [Streptomyces brasiliensis]
MHAYDVSSRRPSFTTIPSARAGRDSPGGPSATPIYDTLYAEWVKSFRTLPGDRTGEEELGFVAFGYAPHSTGTHDTGVYGSTSYGSSVYSAYSAGAYSVRPSSSGQSQVQWQRVGLLGRQDTGVPHVPAALPPGPRRGL